MAVTFQPYTHFKDGDFDLEIEGTPIPRTSEADESRSFTNDLELKERRLISKIVERLDDIRRACHIADVRGNGWIRIDHLRNILSVYCFDVGQRDFHKIMDRWGFKARNLVGYLQFLQKFNNIKTSGRFALPYKDTHWYNPVRGDEHGIDDGQELFRRLKSIISNNHSTLKTSFLKLDESRKGYINWKEFRRVLNRLSVTITDEQFTKLMNMIDPEKKGKISYHQFLNMFEDRETEEGHPWLKGTHIPQYSIPPPALDQITVERIVRNKIQDNWSGFTKAFLKIDLNKDGLLSKEELAEMLKGYSIPMSDETFEKMWLKCDEDNNGEVEFYEFMSRLGVDIYASDLDGFSKRIHDEMDLKKKARKNELHDIEERETKRQENCVSFKSTDQVMDFLKEFVIQRSTNFRQTFLRFDHNGDGKISIVEFKKLLQQLSINLKPEMFKELLSKFKFFNGKLSYPNFLMVFQDTKLCRKQDLIRIPNHRYNDPIEAKTFPEEEIVKKLKQKICENSETMFKAFQHADINKDNTVSKKEFLRLLNVYMIPLSEEKMGNLLIYLGVENGKQINYIQFLKKFQDTENLKMGHPWLFTKYIFKDSRPLNNVSAEKAFRMLAEKVTDQWLTLSEAYRNFNRDVNDFIDNAELKEILNRFNIPVGDDEFKRLWAMFDTDGDGSIDNNEFLKKLGTELAPGDQVGLSSKIMKGNTIALQIHEAGQRKRNAVTLRNQILSNKFITAAQLEQRLRDKFRDGFESFKKAFRKMDKNLDGSLSKEEFMQVLNRFHYYIEQSELNKLFKNVGLDLTERISYVDFIHAFDVLANNNQANNSPPLSQRGPSSFNDAQSKTKETELFQVLRKMVRDNTEFAEKVFNDADTENKGFLTLADLHAAIKNSYMNLSKKQYMSLLSFLGLPNIGSITFNLFMDAVNKIDSRRSSCEQIPTKIRRNLSFKPSSSLERLEPLRDQSRQKDIITLEDEKAFTEKHETKCGEESSRRNSKSSTSSDSDSVKLPDITPTSPRKDNTLTIEKMIRKCWQHLFKLCRKHAPYSDKMKFKLFCDILVSQGIYATDNDIRLMMKANGFVGNEVPYAEILKAVIKKTKLYE